MKMYCEDCKEIVEVRIYQSRRIGYCEMTCPRNEEHNLVDYDFCKCGDDKSINENYCNGCKEQMKIAWDRFKGALPFYQEPEAAIDYINEEVETCLTI